MKTINKIIAYSFCTILIITTTFYYNLKIVYGANTLVVDPSELSGLYEDWNSQYHLYFSPELGIYGLDQIYQDINDKLYDKFGWDIENLDDGFEDYMSSIDWEHDSAASTLAPQNHVDLTDYLEEGYVFLRHNFPTWWNNAKENFMYLWGKIDSVTGTITDVDEGSMIIPITEDTFSAFDDVLDDLLQNGKIKNLSQNHIWYTEKIALPNTSGTSTIILNLSTSKPLLYYKDSRNYVYCIVPANEISINNNQGIFNNITASGTKIINSTVHEIASIRLDNPTSINKGGIQYITGLLVTEFTSFSQQTKSTAVLPLYDDVAEYLENENVSAYGYDWSIDTVPDMDYTYLHRLKELLDSLVGHYARTDDIATLIDTLEGDSVVVPYPQEEDGVITDSLPLLLPQEGVLEDVEDIIDDIIEWSEPIEDILDDIADDTINADPTPDPDPEPDNPLPENPPNLPSWFWPSLFPDIFNFKGLDIFKPIFDIVGTSYSMYSVWSMIPAIIIFVVILYFIISVL